MRELVKVENLSKIYRIGNKKYLHAVSDVSLQLRKGETLALVGESGCGKSTLGRMLACLTRPSSGRVIVDNQDMTRLSNRALRPWRARIQMIFQDSYASFNPSRSVGQSLEEPLRIHKKPNIRRIIEDISECVGILYSDLERYPDSFSGGQRQRLNIARSLVLKPDLIIADEPVSALDISIQAQIVNLFSDLRRSFGLSCIFISHDLSVVRQMADRIGVMYLGCLVEEGDSLSLIARPAHPYTRELLKAIPRIDNPLQVGLLGEAPSPINLPAGCRFHTRCAFVQDRCRKEQPALKKYDKSDRKVACHYPLV